MLPELKHQMPPLTIGSITVPTPIVLGGMAVRIGQVVLPAAVANEGGIGLIGGSGMKVKEVAATIREAKSRTNGPIGLNLMQRMYRFREVVNAALGVGVDLLVISAGFSRDVFPLAAEHNTPVVAVVSSIRAAELAERFGAAAVVLEGSAAAGHLGTEEDAFELLPGVLEAVDVPVILAGGIIDGEDIHRAISLGAAGVQMGSRLALSSTALGDGLSPKWQKSILEAGPEDLVIVKSPAGLPFRAVRNHLTKVLEAEGVYHMPGPRPSCKEHCLRECSYRDSGFTESLCIISALQNARAGDLENGLVTCGLRAAEIKYTPSIPALFYCFRRDYNKAVQEREAA